MIKKILLGMKRVPAILLIWMIGQAAYAIPGYTITSSVTNYPYVDVTVELTNNATTANYNPIAGLQFDLFYPASTLQYVSVTPGALVSPLTNRDQNAAAQNGSALRVMMYSQANASIAPGSYGQVAVVRFKKIGVTTASPFTLLYSISGDPTANSVAVNADSVTTSFNWGPDTDSDGTPDTWDEDDDGDGMPDIWENKYSAIPGGAAGSGFNSLSPQTGTSFAVSADYDGDTLTNLAESQKGTNPFLQDTDGDGVNDNLDINPLLDNKLIPAIISIINSLLLN
ncbi:MAG: hypothetical protein HY272_03110 [Gammaproteobacteria bacterium]|nr:hypothetical protein [Gammaproteobacteria bacterium]